jgi:hypothetical protein
MMGRQGRNALAAYGWDNRNSRRSSAMALVHQTGKALHRLALI